MAYLTHTAYRAKSEPASAFHATCFAAAALAVTLVAGAYAAMSNGADRSAATADAAAKSDRLAIMSEPARSAAVGASINSGGVQTMTDPDGSVVFHQDQAQRTTTVVRGASIPLSESSPYPAAR